MMTVTEAAERAAVLGSGLVAELLIVSARTADPAERRAAAARAWYAWPKVQRAMSELSRVTPVTTEEGMDADYELQAAIARFQAQGGAV